MKQNVYSVIILTLLLACGCSGQNNSTAVPDLPSSNEDPSLSEISRAQNSSSRVLLGFYEVQVDSSDGTVEVIPLRGVDFNMNIAHFLAPPYSPTQLITIKILQGTNFFAGYIDIDLAITHPFPGINMYKIFDTRCILMSDGTKTSDHDPDIRFGASENNEMYMLNPDGYTRWWNATEFTDPLPLLSYKPYAIGTLPFPNATLNPYKYYADVLTLDSDVADLPPETRGVFSNSLVPHSRHFKIQFPMVDGNPVYKFNLAVDASWAMPDPSGAPGYPVESFPPDAQTQEAYHAVLDTSETDASYIEGTPAGSVRLSIEIYDWQGLANPDGVPGEISAIWIESPVLSSPVDILPIATASPGSQTTSSVFDVELGPGYLNLTEPGTFRVLGCIESADPTTYIPQIVGGENYIYPEGPLASYFMGEVKISGGGGWTLVFPDPAEQISDSGGEDWNNEAPRLIMDGQGNLVVSWAQNRPNVPDQLDARPVDRISYDQGNTWNPLDTWPVDTADRDGCLKGTKMALDGNGDAYALDFWFDEEDGGWGTFWCNYLIRCPLDSDDDWGWQTSMSIHGVEVIFSIDEYPLCFEDYDLFPGYTGIWVVRGWWQNSPMGKASGQWNEHSWFKGNYFQVAEDPAALSTGPSIQRDAAGTIWLAYQNGPFDSDQILMVHNLDPMVETWSIPLILAQAEPPYNRCYDPTLWLDSNGGMHLAFLKSTSGDPPEYSIVYMDSESGDPADFSAGEIPFAGTQDLSFPTIQCVELPSGIAPVMLIATSDGTSHIKWRDPESGEWSDPIQVDLNSQSTTPAMWIDQDNLYVHVVWSEPDIDGYMQIHYRLGTFVEQ